MPNNLYGGFRPYEHQKVPAPRRYPIASGTLCLSGAASAFFRGDPMTLLTTGYVSPVRDGATDAGILMIGVLSHVSYVDGGGVRVERPFIPSGTTWAGAIDTAACAYAYIWDDPSLIYVANMALASTSALIGAMRGCNMDHTSHLATPGNVIFGQSGVLLDGAAIAATAQWRILEARRTPTADKATIWCPMLCQMNECAHPFMSLAGI